MSAATPDPGTTPADPGDPAAPPPAAARTPTFEQHMEWWGKGVGDAGERFGRDAEAWGHRMAKDPTLQRAGDTAARTWGLLVLAVGIWFCIDVPLGYEMPRIPWSDVWPVGLIVIGLVVVLRGDGPARRVTTAQPR